MIGKIGVLFVFYLSFLFLVLPALHESKVNISDANPVSVSYIKGQNEVQINTRKTRHHY